MKIFTFFSMLLVFTLSSLGQTAVGVNGEFTRIKDDKADISILFPADFIVDSEFPKQMMLVPSSVGMLPGVKDVFEKPRVVGTLKSLRIDLRVIRMQQVAGAKEYFWYVIGPSPPVVGGRTNILFDIGPHPSKDKTDDFAIGDFVGKHVNYDTDKELRMTIAIAHKSRMFVIHATAKPEDQPLYEAFVKSLVINGKPLFNTTSAVALSETKTVLISQLQTSPEVSDALNQKQQKSDISVSETSDPTFENDGNLNFSRRVITLRHPQYFKELDFPKGMKEPITIRVTYLATGKVGSIMIPSGMPKSFVNAVLKSATEIRFLPAEINGKKVDARLVVNYPPFST